MANALGINLGEVYRTAEAVKGARQKREFAAEDRDAARQRAQTMNALRGRVAAGEEGAMQEFIALAPEEAKQTLDAYNAMDERERAQVKENVDNIGRMAAYVLQSSDPQAAYQQVRSQVNPELAQGMPEQFDPNWVSMQLARARELDDMLAPPEIRTLGSQDIAYDSTGREIGRATTASTTNALIRSQASGEEDARLSATDTNAIYRQAVGMFGGVFDPISGNVTGLDSDTAGRAQAVAEEASRLYAAGESQSHAAAVAQASRRLGLSVENLGTRREGGGMDRNRLLEQYQ